MDDQHHLSILVCTCNGLSRLFTPKPTQYGKFILTAHSGVLTRTQSQMNVAPSLRQEQDASLPRGNKNRHIASRPFLANRSVDREYLNELQHGAGIPVHPVVRTGHICQHHIDTVPWRQHSCMTSRLLHTNSNHTHTRGNTCRGTWHCRLRLLATLSGGHRVRPLPQQPLDALFHREFGTHESLAESFLGSIQPNPCQMNPLPLHFLTSIKRGFNFVSQLLADTVRIHLIARVLQPHVCRVFVGIQFQRRVFAFERTKPLGLLSNGTGFRLGPERIEGLGGRRI